MTALIFPAFGAEYTGKERDSAPIRSTLERFLKVAEAVSGFDVELFMAHPRGDFGDELQSQLSCCILSCTAAESLRDRIPGSITAGYSMGLYAALYHAGVIGFADALSIIEDVFRIIHKTAGDGCYSVATIVGFESTEIIGKILESSLRIEIINTNNRFNHIIAGISEDIDRFLDLARSDGAMSLRKLPFLAPYHTSFMRPAVDGVERRLKDIRFSAPEIPVLSTVDQSLIVDAESARNEILRNVFTAINWQRTMEALQSRGVDRFLECGPGRSLQRMSRLMDGDYPVLPLHRIGRECGREDASAITADTAV